MVRVEGLNREEVRDVPRTSMVPANEEKDSNVNNAHGVPRICSFYRFG